MTRRIIAGLALAFTLLTIAALYGAALARDDGRYATRDPIMHAWFDKLASGKGMCCSFADGLSIKDVDWDTALVADADQSRVHYRVRIDGEWIVVPSDAVVTEPNKFGPAVVWPYESPDGEWLIRCFMPSAMS